MDKNSDVRFSQFRFSDMEIALEVLNNNILEGTEVGKLSILPDSTAFDGHEPLYGHVKIVIRDDEGTLYKYNSNRSVS